MWYYLTLPYITLPYLDLIDNRQILLSTIKYVKDTQHPFLPCYNRILFILCCYILVFAMALAYFLCQAMAIVCFFPEKKRHKKINKN